MPYVSQKKLKEATGLMGIQDAAKVLGVKHNTLARWIVDGKYAAPTHCLGGQYRYYTPDEVNAIKKNMADTDYKPRQFVHPPVEVKRAVQILYGSGEYTRKQLATMFDVSMKTIANYINAEGASGTGVAQKQD